MTQIESKVVPNVLSTNTPSISVKPFSCPCISSEKIEKWNQKTAQQQQPTNQQAKGQIVKNYLTAALPLFGWSTFAKFAFIKLFKQDTLSALFNLPF